MMVSIVLDGERTCSVVHLPDIFKVFMLTLQYISTNKAKA